ncbi:MAG: iron-containing redox enzyme family protein [Nanoarchaeota archaeon]
MKVEQDLQEMFARETEEVRTSLIPLRELGQEKMRRMLARYAAAIEPNFIPWVAAGAISARSIQGRYAASENLEEELRGDHQGMLIDFVAQVAARPTIEDCKEVYLHVQNMRNTFREMNGLTNITLLAYLENTSAAFIPYLADAVRSLGGKDFTYTDAHGVADAQHAQQFLWALGYEREHGYDEAFSREVGVTRVIRHANAMGQGFLRGVLGLRVDK